MRGARRKQETDRAGMLRRAAGIIAGGSCAAGVVTAGMRRWENTATAAAVAVASFLVIVTVDTLGAMRESARRQGELADEQRMDRDMEIVEETHRPEAEKESEPNAQHTEGNGGFG